MMFADDVVLCAREKRDLEEDLEQWRYAQERRGMKISRSKTGYTSLNGTSTGSVEMLQRQLPETVKFKYLGSTLETDGGVGSEVNRMIRCGCNNWKMSGVLCDKSISWKVKGRIHMMVIQLAMLYVTSVLLLTCSRLPERSSIGRYTQPQIISSNPVHQDMGQIQTLCRKLMLMNNRVTSSVLAPTERVTIEQSNGRTSLCTFTNVGVTAQIFYMALNTISLSGGVAASPGSVEEGVGNVCGDSDKRSFSVTPSGQQKAERGLFTVTTTGGLSHSGRFTSRSTQAEAYVS
nr:uncharacterized protein LOC113819164 [Penaeus vannamei]